MNAVLLQATTEARLQAQAAEAASAEAALQAAAAQAAATTEEEGQADTEDKFHI